jgi:hypothetical protein
MMEAANNHQRFVRAQFVPVLEFPGYEQEPWPDLVNLWLLLNRHLVHIIEAMPEARLSHECVIGGKPPEALSTLLEAYVAHLKHHLDQIFTTTL